MGRIRNIAVGTALAVMTAEGPVACGSGSPDQAPTTPSNIGACAAAAYFESAGVDGQFILRAPEGSDAGCVTAFSPDGQESNPIGFDSTVTPKCIGLRSLVTLVNPSAVVTATNARELADAGVPQC